MHSNPVDKVKRSELTQVTFDYAITISTQLGDTFRLGGPFTISSRDGEEAFVDPEKPGMSAVAVLTLLHVDVLTAGCDEDGTLVVTMDNGRTVRCEPLPEYEAWTANLASGALVVCTPGGELATWEPPRS